MANLRAIRTRIKSVENTRQITKSMKMVAAAKLRKTQTAFASLRAYAEESGKLLKEASAGQTGIENPYLTPHAECRKICYVLQSKPAALLRKPHQGQWPGKLCHRLRTLGQGSDRRCRTGSPGEL